MAKKKVAKKKVAKKAKKTVKKKLTSTAVDKNAVEAMASVVRIMQRMRENQKNREEEAKAVFKELAPKLFLNGVAKVHVEYNGEGDSGDIEHIAYLDTNDDSVDSGLPEGDEERLKNAIWPFVPAGFENNEGGFGNVDIDLTTNLVLCEHSERVTETHESSTEFTF